jgi:signal transduction histidine kinase
MGRAELHPKPEDLSAIVRSITDELARREPDRRVEVTITDGLVAAADRRLIRAALENLLGNAWKFSGKAEHAEISFTATHEDGQLVFCVADNGDGFDMKYAERLFHPFHRLHDEKDFPGTGIGLATVHRIIERHGGRVWADAAPGRGAKFSFTLPSAPLTAGGTR